jgi:hypothetical protein
MVRSPSEDAPTVAIVQGAQRVRWVKQTSTDPVPHHDVTVTARPPRGRYGRSGFHSSWTGVDPVIG